MPVTVSIPVERILITINVRIIAAVVATEISWFRSDDANNDSQQQDCVLKNKEEQVPSSKCGKCHETSIYIYIYTDTSIDSTNFLTNSFVRSYIFSARLIPSFKFTTLSKNNILRIIKSFQLMYTNTEKWCSPFFNIICRRRDEYFKWNLNEKFKRSC